MTRKPYMLRISTTQDRTRIVYTTLIVSNYKMEIRIPKIPHDSNRNIEKDGD